ncbi:SAM-dependent methyltransferase [Clostridium sp. AM42-4]|uniref:class I SAM-dependent methyltransferase n=1 Tax=Clostridium sp. AM42-4 TaxID=2292305 RepID=UPI000E524083|nr:SAM-dependent methyltransferase [Clostridium sp. AM42-4]RHS83990.1 SAM-dependent methyltransferase [Clostridium sp. AM42-4]
MAKETLTSMLDYFINERLNQLVLSNPAEKDHLQKVKVRPILIRGALVFQAEEFTKTQAFHKNLGAQELKSYLSDMLSGTFKQAEVLSELGSATVLVSKKGTMTVKTRKNPPAKMQAGETKLQHNRQKRYVIPEGHPVPFLVDLGVQTQDGRIVKSRYDKFRQINRFLEFIEDILPKLDKTRENVIIDFGCGKSYLTFAMYYYLHEMKGYPIRIIGLDLKKDVISHCGKLAEHYGYDNLKFYHGDIASYEGVDHVDMVVTLHACDTATDYALEKAVRWGAKVILSVPCCQHELNKQMKNDLMEPVLHYGLIKERMAALYTDALRAELLEQQGYRTQILEFIDMEHTPKNILLRAVYEGKPKHNEKEIQQILEFLQIEPTLYQILGKDKNEKADES